MEDTAARRRSDLLMMAKEIGEMLGVATGLTAEFTRVSAAEDASFDSIVFAEDERALLAAIGSGAGLILARRDAVGADTRMLRVDDPRYAFALCARALRRASEESGAASTVHATAVIEEGAAVGVGCRIGPNVTVYGCVRMGDRVVVQAGAVLGAMGFGYVRDKDGTYLLSPQQGLLAIEDDVRNRSEYDDRSWRSGRDTHWSRDEDRQSGSHWA